MMALWDNRRSHFLCEQLKGGHPVLSTRENRAKPGHDFDHDKNESPGSFAVFIWSDCALLYACLASHQSLLYTDDVEESLVKPLRMEEVIIPQDSVLIDHGDCQRAGGDWSGRTAYGTTSA